MATISMTGYGFGTAESGGVRVDVELNSVNRKQFDFALSVSPELAFSERSCRELVQKHISRGRVQCQIKTAFHDGGDTEYDVEAIKLKAAQMARLAEVTGVENDIALSDILAMPNMTMSAAGRLSRGEMQMLIVRALELALASLSKMKATEGASLGKDIASRIEDIRAMRAQVAAWAPEVPRRYQETLMRRIAELGSPLPEGDVSLAREVALCADRCDISEELTRLDTHLDHFMALLASAGPCGRPLDFLCQEINREVNTVGSKANDARIAGTVIDMKSALEAVREQVQNLE